MSRIANAPVLIPAGVEVESIGSILKVKGAKGSLTQEFHESVIVAKEAGELRFSGRDDSKNALAQAGTARSLANNMVIGVCEGFERRLNLTGVGYRAHIENQRLHLSLGFSHPVIFALPAGIEVETPSQTEILISGIDKQQVGQAAAIIRSYRPPEPYKGKGVRYANEQIVRKEAKKK